MAITDSSNPSPSTPIADLAIEGEAPYEPGICNIGPEEIARRRRSGRIGLAATAVLLGGLVAVRAPRAARLVVALPAAGAAAGYLQARYRFCAGFGAVGVYNFGPVGPTTRVRDADAVAKDRLQAARIGLASAAVGVGVGIASVLLPVR